MSDLFRLTNTEISNSTPLRYPGGKTRAIPHLFSLLPDHLDSLCSPFIGGGSFEVAVAAHGVKVYAYDIFKPLTDFWREISKDAKAVADMVAAKYFPLEKEKFYNIQRDYEQFDDPVERAAIFFVLNRSSFGGATFSGGMVLKGPRFTESAINKLANYANDNLIVQNSHFGDTLAKHEGEFLYLDPPYTNGGQDLYGINGSTHRNFDHEALATLLKGRDRWLLSYNDCEQVRDLYAGHVFIRPHWHYGMHCKKGKTYQEVMILSA